MVNSSRDDDSGKHRFVGNQFGYFKEEDVAVVGAVGSRDVSLREWLDNTERVVDPLDCLHIFMQIVEIVNLAHSQGFVVHNVRPSCFVMSSSSRLSFIDSVSCEDESNNQTAEFVKHLNPKKLMEQILQMESNWYTSPEEAAGGPCCCASDVYRLGVLLFELYCTSSSVEEKSSTMSSLRHRVFPPQFLLNWPKEALFCLWLLHPEPGSRPKIDEVLKSEFLNEPRDDLNEHEVFLELKEKIEEQELLLEFLLMLQQRKQEAADNFRRTVAFVSSDLQEVTKLQASIREQKDLKSNNEDCLRSRKRIKTTEISNSFEPDH